MKTLRIVFIALAILSTSACVTTSNTITGEETAFYGPLDFAVDTFYYFKGNNERWREKEQLMPPNNNPFPDEAY